MQVLETIKEACRQSWSGEIGEQRATETEAFILSFLPSYAEVLDMTQEQVLNAIEAGRNINTVNYYQKAYFPSLDGVIVFDTQKDFLEAVPSKQFRCPSCGGVSSDPNKCDISKECGWTSYGLLGTLGKGARIVVKDTFLESPKVHEIFMPLELEEKEADA